MRVTTSNQVIVRTATPRERSLVSSILEEAHAWLVARDLSLWSPSTLTPEALRPDVEAGHYVLAFSGEDAAGTARLTRDDFLYWPDAVGERALYLHRLAVRRAHAGSAVSGALLQAGLERARDAECDFLRLDCRADVPRLRDLYTRQGFVLESEVVVNGHRSARFQKLVPRAVFPQD